MRVQSIANKYTDFNKIPVGSFFKFMSIPNFSKIDNPLEVNHKIDAIGNIFFKTEEIEVDQSKQFFYNAVNITTGNLFYFLDNDVGMVYSEDDIAFNFNVSAISLSNPISTEKNKRKINIIPKEKPVSFSSIFAGNIFSIVSDSNSNYNEDYNKDKNYFDFISAFFYIKVPTVIEKYYNNYDSENTHFNTCKINAVNLCTCSYVCVHADAQVINFNSDCVFTFK